MTTSIYETIMTNFDTRLKTILTSGGYQTNAGSNVFEWREEPLPETELPAFENREILEAPNDDTLQTWMHTLTIRIRASAISIAQARQILADVIQAVGTDTTFSQAGLITRFGGAETEVRHEEKKYFSMMIIMNLFFNTTEWSLYG